MSGEHNMPSQKPNSRIGIQKVHVDMAKVNKLYSTALNGNQRSQIYGDTRESRVPFLARAPHPNETSQRQSLESNPMH